MKKSKKPKKKNRLDHSLLKADREHDELLLTAVSQKRKNEVKRITREKKRIIKKLWKDGDISILMPRGLDKGA